MSSCIYCVSLKDEGYRGMLHCAADVLMRLCPRWPNHFDSDDTPASFSSSPTIC